MYTEEAGWSTELAAAREVCQGVSQRSASRRRAAGSQLVDGNRRRPAVQRPQDGAVPRHQFAQSGAGSLPARQVSRQRSQAQLRLFPSGLLRVQLRVLRRTAARDCRSRR